MRIRKAISITALLLWGAGILAPSAGAGLVTFKAVMIYASNEPAPLDRRLEKIEYKLRRVFRFEHYKHAGGGSASVALPGATTLQLGGGHTLSIVASEGKDGNVKAQFTWKKGGSMLLRSSAGLRRGSSTVLGGVSQGKGKLIVTLEAR